MRHISLNQFAEEHNVDPATLVELGSAVRGGMWPREARVLVGLLKFIGPTKAFEFGTYRGDTTRLLAQSFDGTVYTLDLDSIEGVSFAPATPDRVLAEEATAVDRDFAGLDIVQLLGDSYHFDPTPYEGEMGFIFVDGNHDLKYLQRDSDNASRMAANRSVIVWHDYGYPEHPKLTAYLDSLGDALCHVEGTHLVYRLR
jgi:predicted O-methyltransferase YrrM